MHDRKPGTLRAADPAGQAARCLSEKNLSRMNDGR